MALSGPAQFAAAQVLSICFWIMSLTNYKQTAAPSRSGPAERDLFSSNKIFNNQKLEPEKDPAAKPLDLDRFLLGKSTHLRRSYSEDELKQLGVLYSGSIAVLNVRFENILYRSSKRRKEMSLISPGDSFESVLRRMWDQKKSRVLLDVYYLIFTRGVNYALVFLGLCKALEERFFFSEFSDALSDPLTLMVTSVMEYAERQATCKSGLKESKS